MKFDTFVVALSLVALSAQAAPENRANTDSDAAVLAILAKNRIVTAAVEDAKVWSGAKNCKQTVVKADRSPQFEKGSTYDIEVSVTCGDSNAMGIVTIKGRLFGSHPLQAIEVKIDFAG